MCFFPYLIQLTKMKVFLQKQKLFSLNRFQKKKYNLLLIERKKKEIDLK